MAAAGLWLVGKPAGRRADPPEDTVEAPAAASPAPASAPPSQPPPRLPPQPQPQPQPPQPREAAAPPQPRLPPAPEAPGVVGAHADDLHAPGMAPHPMDEARERLYAETRLVQRLNDAMSFRKVKEMREMIDEYRRLDPKDVDASQAGYTVIADCIESPGEASLAAAHQFYDTQRHSPLRRWVRRICFESSN